MSTINFTHLRALAIFSTVIETGSFAATARRLRSSRSRVSEQVSALERDLGIRLLQRSTRQLKITDEGAKVYEEARKLSTILQQVESLTIPSAPRGRVGITMPHDIAHKFMLPILSDFQRQYPEVYLDIIPDDRPLNMISEQIDLAIRVGIPKEESIIARVMYEEKFQLFASPDYIDKVGSIKTLKDIEKCHSILFTLLNHKNTILMRQHNKTIEIRPKSYYRSDSPFMIQQMVLKGLGIGSLLPNAVKQEIKNGQLVHLLPSVTSEPIIFSLIYPSRHQIPQRIRVVIDYLLEKKIFG